MSAPIPVSSLEEVLAFCSTDPDAPLVHDLRAVADFDVPLECVVSIGPGLFSQGIRAIFFDSGSRAGEVADA